MNEWKKVKLGDLYEVHNGLSKGRQFFGKGTPFLTFSNVFNNWFLPETFDSLVQVTEKEKDSFSIKRGDVFITRTSETMDELGMSSVALHDYPGATYNGFTKRLRPITDLINPLYIGYYLRSPKFRGKFMAFSSMTTRASLANDDLLNMEVEVPSKSIQHSIAITLSRYDALIANYLRQIKLLEEAAQRLYKEWFVDLHFPGHESVNIIDGVPEGWRSYNIDDVFDIKYGKNLSTKEISSTGKYPVYGANGIIGYYNKYNCEEPVVLITSRGNGSGDVLKTYEQYTFVTNNSFVVKPKAQHSYCTLPFTFGLMCSANFRSVRTGAAQPQLTNASIHHINIVMPPCDIIKKYCSMMETDYKLVRYLRKQLTLLTESRDRLLPKLMSGDIKL